MPDRLVLSKLAVQDLRGLFAYVAEESGPDRLNSSSAELKQLHKAWPNGRASDASGIIWMAPREPFLLALG